MEAIALRCDLVVGHGNSAVTVFIAVAAHQLMDMTFGPLLIGVETGADVDLS